METLVKNKIKFLTKKYENSTATVNGTTQEIYHIMEASFRNMFQNMYKPILKDKCCEHCKTTTKLNRCHAGKTRPEIGYEAIEMTKSKNHGQIMINFVALHLKEPVKILCEPCHRKFDAKPSKEPKNQKLPEGWTIKEVVRQSGATAGRVDKYYYSPSGKKFRSLLEIERYGQ